MSNFNTVAFLEDAMKVHLRVGDTLSDADVMRKLDTFIDYGDNCRFSKALDEICTNVVGRTMFKLLICKLTPCRILKIIDVGPNETGELLHDQTGSSYSYSTHTVKINLNVYSSSGIGISERQYYCMDSKRNIVPKLKSLSASVFHEFVHCLHHLEDGIRYDAYRDKNSLPAGNPWTTKEELRTISGYIEKDDYASVNIYDPIFDNCFDFYNYCIAKERMKSLAVFKPVIAGVR
jgi:hypothetical protein